MQAPAQGYPIPAKIIKWSELVTLCMAAMFVVGIQICGSQQCILSYACMHFAFLDPLYVSGAYYEAIDRRGRFGTDFNITFHSVSFANGQLSTTAVLRMLKSTLWFARK